MRKGGRNDGKPETKKVAEDKKTAGNVNTVKAPSGQDKQQKMKIDFSEGLNFSDEIGGKSEYEINREKIEANEAEIARLQARLNAKPATENKSEAKKDGKKSKKAESREKKAAEKAAKEQAKREAREAKEKERLEAEARKKAEAERKEAERLEARKAKEAEEELRKKEEALKKEKLEQERRVKEEEKLSEKEEKKEEKEESPLKAEAAGIAMEAVAAKESAKIRKETRKARKAERKAEAEEKRLDEEALNSAAEEHRKRIREEIEFEKDIKAGKETGKEEKEPGALGAVKAEAAGIAMEAVAAKESAKIREEARKTEKKDRKEKAEEKKEDRKEDKAKEKEARKKAKEAKKAEEKAREENLPAGEKAIAGSYEFVSVLICATIIIAVLFTFFFRFSSVVGVSMQPGLHSGDWVVLSQMGDTEPHYGDIVVISQPNSFNENIIKRVIATEGEVVDIDFKTGEVKVDGKVLDEPYINNPTINSYDMRFPLIVPKGYCFVMGDNRQNSIDSRSTSIGLIRDDYILGRAAAASTKEGFHTIPRIERSVRY